ncbi:MAG: SCO family protein [Cyclobacteriaceae bacterium]|jgi:protein SCO1/2|nr:SCO family protein [Cyclobacteriaceae bacterium]
MQNKTIIFFIILIATLSIFTACEQKEKPLPIFGQRTVVNNDTLYHKIAPFQFLNQDSLLVTNATVDGKIYVADFFFTSCRTICPIMKTQMLRVYDTLKNDADILILSHTIDPEYDTVGRLRDFAQRLGVSSARWHFLTGAKDSIYKLAQTSYFATAMEDKTEPDGFIHSGAFLLLDKQQRIRGKYDGTKEEEVNKLIADIQRLKKEYEKK